MDAKRDGAHTNAPAALVSSGAHHWAHLPPKAKIAKEHELSEAYRPTCEVKSPNFFLGHTRSKLTLSSWRSVPCERSHPVLSEDVVGGNGAKPKSLSFPVPIFLSLAVISLNGKESMGCPSS